MHGEFARQGTRIYRLHHDMSAAELLAEATSQENARFILDALNRTLREVRHEPGGEARTA